MNLSPREALAALRETCAREDAQLERDAWTAKQRGLLSLSADLARVRTGVKRLLAALDRAENVVARLRDYSDDPDRRPRGAECSFCGADDWEHDARGWHCARCREKKSEPQPLFALGSITAKP